jgi:hypothetical protein
VLAKVITLNNSARGKSFHRVLRYIVRAESEKGATTDQKIEAGHLNLKREPYFTLQENRAAHVEGIAAAFDRDVRQCQRRGRFRGNPAYHVAITWQEGEHPTRPQAQHACEHVMKALGFQECPAVWALHRDSGNDHVHLVVNRIHPIKFTAVTVPQNDYLISNHCMRELDIDLGFSRSVGPCITMDAPTGPKIVPMSRSERRARGLLSPEGPSLTRSAQRAEANLGGDSFQRWLTEEPARKLQGVLSSPVPLGSGCTRPSPSTGVSSQPRGAAWWWPRPNRMDECSRPRPRSWVGAQARRRSSGCSVSTRRPEDAAPQRAGRLTRWR